MSEENKELKKIKKNELFDIKIIGIIFCLVIANTVILGIGFYKFYKFNPFDLYIMIIGTSICLSVFFTWILFKLYTNFKDKFKED